MGGVLREPFFNKSTLREQLAEVLKSKILKGEISPGERLIEEEISKQFNVSRGPVREALRQLEEEGLLSYSSHKGCVVKTLSHRDMKEAYLIRSTLECLAVKIYSGNMTESGLQKLRDAVKEIEIAGKNKVLYDLIIADENFHSAIVEEATCEKLFQMWKRLQWANIATYYTMNTQDLMPYDVVYYNHKIILDIFEGKKDVESINQAIHEHYMIVPETLYMKEHQG